MANPHPRPKGDPCRYFGRYEADPNSGCWLWTGGMGSGGYGLLNFEGKTLKAYRYFYEQFKGPIGDGQHVCHRCDTPACVNPAHLFLGSNSDNIADAMSKRRHRGPHRPARGKELPQTRLDPIRVRAIRADVRPVAQVAMNYGVAVSTIYLIREGKTWRHVV